MPRGRPPNPFRAAARAAGERTYADEFPCEVCGTNKRYVSNMGCVACVIDRGQHRYAGLDEEQKAAQKLRDHNRHAANLLKGTE